MPCLKAVTRLRVCILPSAHLEGGYVPASEVLSKFAEKRQNLHQTFLFQCHVCETKAQGLPQCEYSAGKVTNKCVYYYQEVPYTVIHSTAQELWLPIKTFHLHCAIQLPRW